ncbi:S8 family serine peptidase [Ruminobacter amylophilus]|uniref:S8 family serine peptidase n=1 Tax=Ruminobacter amylophilus TaxID=867 RepID=UPI00386A1AFF
MKLSAKNACLALFNALLLSSITACGSGGDEKDPGPKPKPTPVAEDEITETEQNESNVTLSVTQHGDMFTGKPFIIKFEQKPSVSSLKGQISPVITAKYGVVTDVNPLTDESAASGTVFYYLPLSALKALGDVYSFTEEFTVTDADGNISVYELAQGANTSHGDPLLTDQWHIRNVSQNPFKVSKKPVKGIDLNVIPAWHEKDSNNELLSGKNVRVGVWDAPIDLNHEELKDKIYTPSGITSDVNKGLTLNEVIKNPSILHGTAVSGIIGASAGNAKGGRGIAPDVLLTSYAMNGVDTSFLARKDDLDIVNASIGSSNSFAFDPAFEMTLQAMFENGIPLIKAAGNQFNSITYDHDDLYPTKACLRYKVSCQYEQSSSLERGRYQINVAALNSLGEHSSYSSAGSHIWVSGTGGEFGYRGSGSDSAAVVTSIYSQDPSKYSDWDAGTPWRKDSTNYEARKFYTQRMNGTSAATPSVTGVSALVLQAKPDITVPQLRYILATTARNDRDWSSLAYSSISAYDSDLGETVTPDRGWNSNASGLRFSNRYGFGVVDAEKAVKAALNCNSDELCAKRASLPQDYKNTNSNPCTTSDDGKIVTCIFSDFVNTEDSSDNQSEIEVEEVSVNLNSFGYTSDTPETIVEDDNAASYCDYAASNDGYIAAIAYANNLLQMEIRSPNGTIALVKPVYANWDFSGKVLNSVYGLGYKSPFLVNTSDFFTEKFSASNNLFILTFKSKCSIDVDELNKHIYLLVGGYPDRAAD